MMHPDIPRWSGRRLLPSFTGSALLLTAALARAVDPPGDHFEAPYVLTQPYGTATVDSAVTATTQTGEPVTGTGHTVWFRWTAPADGPVAFDTLNGYFPTVIKAFTGAAVNALAPVQPLADPPAGERTNRLRFSALAGQVYYVQVDASTAQTGRFVLKWWQGAPANDSFSGAAWVDSGVYFFPLSSVNASKEPEEPNHAGNAGGRSVWIPFTADMSRTVNISTEGSDFDTVLAVYTGTSLTSLTEIESSDDFEGETWSRVSFETVRGQTYWIAVDGAGGDGGSILLDIRYDSIVPVFTGIRRVNDDLEVDLLCNDARRFLIEASTDLATWVPWYNTAESEHGELHFTMPGGFSTSSRRFFRAVQKREND